MNTVYTNYEVQTTPGLQFLTLQNQIPYITYKFKRHEFKYCDKDDYFKFLTGWYAVFNGFYEQNLKDWNSNKYESSLLVDCANGTAGYHKNNIESVLSSGKFKDIKFINFNYKDFPNLNENCGAEYLHKEKAFPINYPLDKYYTKNVSFDGDVDRIIYL